MAQMILDRGILKETGFLAIARLEPGRRVEPHVDPMEEIYKKSGLNTPPVGVG